MAPEFGATGDYRDIAPRLGFAYDVFGNGKTSIRGGGGIFYDSRIDGMFNDREVGEAPYSAAVTLTTPKGTFSNPYLGIANPFPAPFPPLGNSTFVSPVQVESWDPYSKLTTPRTYNWNVTLEQELKHDWLLRAACVGSRANHLSVTVDQNPAVYTAGSTLSTDQRRPFAGFSNIYQDSQAGNSWYQSAQLTLQKRFSHGFTIMANYTFSKSLDNLPFNTDAATFGTSGYYTLPVYLQNFQMFDRGRSDFDRRHVFVTSYVWRLPSLAKANMWVRGAAGGWEVSGIVSALSGGPLTLYAGKDQSQTGIGSDRALMVNQQVYGSGACQSNATCVNYINPSAFVLPAAGTFGNVGKGLLSGPGLFNWDMQLSKSFKVKELLTLQARAEFFNVFNRVNFSNPVTTVKRRRLRKHRGRRRSSNRPTGAEDRFLIGSDLVNPRESEGLVFGVLPKFDGPLNARVMGQIQPVPPQLAGSLSRGAFPGRAYPGGQSGAAVAGGQTHRVQPALKAHDILRSGPVVCMAWRTTFPILPWNIGPTPLMSLL